MALDDALDAAALAGVLIGVCDAMNGSVEELTHADQAIGDGDHGLAIGRGFRAAREAIVGSPPGGDVGALLGRVGLALLTSMGGASGAIYGTFFRRGAAALGGHSLFDATSLADFLEAGLIGVRERGGAKVGDKTMVDAMQPAVEAARGARSTSLRGALAAVALAADEGLETTRAMQATLGRARTLGERAVGHVDPGALSFTIMIREWSRLVDMREAEPPAASERRAEEPA